MATGLEILGGIAAAAQLTKVVTNFIINFGTRQNAPRQVKRLERILEDLNDVHLIEAASQRERERLWELILVAEQTLNDHIAKARPNRLLRFFWPEDAEEQLKGLNDELQTELLSLGFRVDRRHRASISPIIPGTQNPYNNVSPLLVGEIAPPYIAHPHPPRPIPPQFNALGCQTAIDATAVSKPHELPTTLYLQTPNGITITPPLKLKFLRVLERDESTRLIHYERRTPHSHLEVTHRIPRSCLRFEDDKLDDLQVHFLDAHPITVVRTGKGHEVYFLHAKYEFGSLEQREEFVARMLERELLGRFYAEEVVWRGALHAQGKVVRLWRKGGEGNGEGVVTKLTFLAREERQWEWDLERFSRGVVLDGDRVILRESGGGGSVDKDREMVIKFPPSSPGRKRSSVSTAAATSKKRERRESAQGIEEKPSGSQLPERKKSTWSLRRFSRTGTTGIEKETLGVSPDLTGTLSRSPDSPTSPAVSLATSGFRVEIHANSETDDAASEANSMCEAERFKEIFQQFHPSSIPNFTPLPPVAATTALGIEWGSGEGGFKTGFAFGGSSTSGYDAFGGKGAVTDYASSVATTISMSAPTSPQTEPLPSSASGTTVGTSGSSGGGVIRPRLESLYPP